MLLPKCILILLLLNLACESICKPTESPNYITEGRGIGSTIWGWITYPFSWWSSEPDPVHDQLIGSTTIGPYDNVEVERRNVTVWCNEQTCTTMRCDKYGCKNTTCNIYDTDLEGECREYVTKPDEPAPTKPAETVSSIGLPVSEAPQKPTLKPDIITDAPAIKPVPTESTDPFIKPEVTQNTQKPNIVTNAPEIRPLDATNAPDSSQAVDERPLELEAVLSSTVAERNIKDPLEELVNFRIHKA